MGKCQFYWLWLKKAFVKPLLFVDLLAGILAIVGGIIVHYNPQWSDTVSVLMWAIPSAIFVTGVVIGFFRAPYLIYKGAENERDKARSLLLAKPKPKPLSNRNELRGAIASAEQATIELANKVNALKNADSKDPYLAYLTTEADKAYDFWNHSMNELRRQYLIAGDAYEGICIELSGFIWMQIWGLMDKIKYPPDTKPIIMQDILQFTGELASRVKKVLQQIDEISGQVLDMEDSQTK